jgi:hypothetical protein
MQKELLLSVGTSRVARLFNQFSISKRGTSRACPFVQSSAVGGSVKLRPIWPNLVFRY